MIPRYLSPLVEERRTQFPCVLIVGARQVGKSTLALDLIDKSWPARYLTLDDRTVLDEVLLSPDGFLSEVESPLVVDEVQRAPDLLRAIKLQVDRNRKPGRFLLTGSANVLTLSTVSETLAGHVAVQELLPFSWAELHQDPAPETIDHLFDAASARDFLDRMPSCGKQQGRAQELKAFILSGGYPVPALMASESRR